MNCISQLNDCSRKDYYLISGHLERRSIKVDTAVDHFVLERCTVHQSCYSAANFCISGATCFSFYVLFMIHLTKIGYFDDARTLFRRWLAYMQ